MDHHQTANDLADSTFLTCIDDSGMIDSCCSQSKKIIVLRKDDTPFVARPLQLLSVRCA